MPDLNETHGLSDPPSGGPNEASKMPEARRSDTPNPDAEEHFRLLIENAKEYAIFVMDADTRITRWNVGAERILGWTEAEAVGQPGAFIFTPEDRARGGPEQEQIQARRNGSAIDERWHIRKDGSRFWANGIMVALRDSGVRGFVKILRDNTAAKIAAEEREVLLAALSREQGRLQELNTTLEERVEARTHEVRTLASMLTLAEQEERRRIALILHDNVQQLLFGIQMKVVHLRRRLGTGAADDVLEGLGEIEGWANEAFDITRRMTVDLNPTILKSEDLGEILTWLGTQMAAQYALKTSVLVEQPCLTRDEELRVLVFTIVREVLFNVVKHAQAGHVLVRLRRDTAQVTIDIIDDGRGFEVPATLGPSPHSGYGLFSIRERLLLFGGSLDITSAPGEGTTVTLHFPERLHRPGATG